MYNEVLEIAHDPSVVVATMMYMEYCDQHTGKSLTLHKALNQIFLFFVDEL